MAFFYPFKLNFGKLKIDKEINMAFAGIIIGLLLIFAGIWLFAMTLFLNDSQDNLLEAVRFGGSCFVAGIAIFAVSYYFARQK